MISQETSMILRHYAKEGVPKAVLARQFGVSRQTVYNHIACEGSNRRPRKVRSSKLDPYKDFIRARLDRFDLPATVVLQEIKSKGYSGSITIVRDFVRSVKKKKVIEVTERFETEPGRQGQLDFAECGSIWVDGERSKLYLIDYVLGYSRMMWGKFLISTQHYELFTSLCEAFDELGIAREMLVDNMKQAVDHHDPHSGTIRFNKKFLDFAEHFGCLPVAAPPYWPRVKGKVERNIDYVKRSFLCGRRFSDLDDLNAQFFHWQRSVANVRIHGTTGERPVDRYEREKDFLVPARTIPTYDARPVEIRKVRRDSHINFSGVSYSVDPIAVGYSVTVRPEGQRVGSRFEVYLGEELVAVHYRRRSGSPRVTLPEHEVAIRRLAREGGRSARRERKMPQFEQVVRSEPVLGHYGTSPVVQTRTLELYENLLGVGS